jgi:hypothetical protein
MALAALLVSNASVMTRRRLITATYRFGSLPGRFRTNSWSSYHRDPYTANMKHLELDIYSCACQWRRGWSKQFLCGC